MKRLLLPIHETWKLLIPFVLFLFSLQAIAQNDVLHIKGTVKSDEGELLSNVSVKVKGAKTGTTTAADGTYNITVKPGQTLVFSSVGFNDFEAVAKLNLTINVTLRSRADKMNEVVVIGYGGTANKLTTTGAISKVTAGEFKTTTVNTVDQILQGRTAGVSVISTSGEPGADIIVNIRGINSISGNNQPLYVIDGFPVPPGSDAPSTNTAGSGRANGLFGLNPNDIESIEVLKDAAATAIYGSRAANGVVLITTKRGRVGESTIEVTNKSTIGVISSPYQMMNSMQYVDAKNEQLLKQNQLPPFSVEDFAGRASTNWLKAITRNSLRQETGISFRGGAGLTNYFLSASYLSERGVVINSGNKRGNVRFNINSEVKKWYSVRGQFTATRQNTLVGVTLARQWPAGGGPILNSLRAAPVFENNPDLLEGNDAIDGVVLGSAANPFVNPVLAQGLKRDNRYSDQIIANLENIFYLDSRRNYEVHAVIGTAFTNVERQTLQPALIDRANGGTVQQGKTKSISYNGSAFILQRIKKDKFSVNNTLGVEFTENNNENYSAVGLGLDYSDVALWNLNSARSQRITSGKSANLIQSAFYRTILNFKSRYVLSASIRLDGSSRFAENKKTGWFPSGGFAWNLSEESFMKKVRFINLAKFRVSYGATGNDRSLPENRSLRLYGTTFYEIGPGGGASPFVPLSVSQPGNPNLVWESTQQFNTGLDLAFLNNKLNVSFEYYNKLTKDLLQNVPFPTQSGFGNIWSNVGTIRNRGVELTVNTNQVTTKNFSWSTNLNVSHNRTILVDLGKFDPFTPANMPQLGGNLLAGSSHALIPGRDIGLFYGYKVVGLYQLSDFNPDGTLKAGVPVFTGSSAPDTRPGRLKFMDTNGSPNWNVNDSDKVVIGNASPDFTFGFTNNFSYKNFNLSFLFTGSVGNDVQNMTDAYIRSGNLALVGVSFNQTQEWYKNRWTLANQHNDPRYPAVQTTQGVVTPDANSVMIEDGSYVRLKNITLGYNFNLKRVKFIRSLTAYITGTDLFIITRYTGFDPEASSYGADPRLQGIDYGAYPRNRNITLGVTVSL